MAHHTCLINGASSYKMEAYFRVQYRNLYSEVRVNCYSSENVQLKTEMR